MDFRQRKLNIRYQLRMLGFSIQLWAKNWGRRNTTASAPSAATNRGARSVIGITITLAILGCFLNSGYALKRIRIKIVHSFYMGLTLHIETVDTVERPQKMRAPLLFDWGCGKK